jgi:hypothetical protein
MDIREKAIRFKTISIALFTASGILWTTSLFLFCIHNETLGTAALYFYIYSCLFAMYYYAEAEYYEAQLKRQE